MKVRATVTLAFEAPDGSDPWDLVRKVTTGAVHTLRDCKDIRPEIVSVTADGKKVTFQPRRRS